jgi:hypothetical protein
MLSRGRMVLVESRLVWRAIDPGQGIADRDNPEHKGRGAHCLPDWKARAKAVTKERLGGGCLIRHRRRGILESLKLSSL